MSARHRNLWPVLVFTVVVALYLPTLRGGFVYDSIAQVLHSNYIHNPAHWADVLTLRVVGRDELDRNRPLHLASLMADASLWGKNPLGYRLTSVLLHALNASLLCALIAQVLRLPTPGGVPSELCSRGGTTLSPATDIGAGSAAVFGAMLFALHPLVVEAVAEPSNREDLLVLLPLLAGLLFIARANVAPSRSLSGLNVALVVCAFFAVLAKESGIAVPYIFAVACALFVRPGLRRCLPGLFLGALAAGIFLAASYIWRPRQSGIFVNDPAPIADGLFSLLEVQVRIWVLQLRQIAWPSNLSAHYTAEVLGGIPSLSAALLLFCLAAAAAFFAFKSRPAALGLAIYVLALLPVSNFAPQFHPVADRYLYVPLAGAALVAAAGVERLRRIFPSPAAGCALLAAGLGFLSFEYAGNLQRQRVWQTPLALWNDVLRQYPRLAQAHLGLANVHYRDGNFAGALLSANDCVTASSGSWAEPFAIRALCRWKAGLREQALEDFLTARRLSRAYESRQTMAATLIFSQQQLADWDEMESDFRR